MNNDEVFRDGLLEIDAYITEAKKKLFIAKTYYHYDAYVQTARWRISYDVVSKILKYVVLHKDSYEKTLMGLPIDICDGEEILQLYVEV